MSANPFQQYTPTFYRFIRWSAFSPKFNACWNWLGIICGLVLLGSLFVEVHPNESESLPGKWFAILKWQQPGRGDLGVFIFNGFGHIERGAHFLKVIEGAEGDIVTNERHADGCLMYKVNGREVGCAKPKSRTGLVLTPGPTGTIPKGRFFVRGTHKDSLDSRYATVGWVYEEQFIGRAVRLW